MTMTVPCPECERFMGFQDGKAVCTVCDGEVRPVEKLADAHSDAEKRRPEQGAMPSKWIAFHRANEVISARSAW